MKANEAPEKLYIDLFKGEFNVSYSPTNNSVEYTRIDAFIEKAVEFLDECIPDYIDLTHANVDTFIDVDNKRFIENFRNYMKGEQV